MSAPNRPAKPASGLAALAVLELSGDGDSVVVARDGVSTRRDPRRHPTPLAGIRDTQIIPQAVIPPPPPIPGGGPPPLSERHRRPAGHPRVHPAAQADVQPVARQPMPATSVRPPQAAAPWAQLDSQAPVVVEQPSSSRQIPGLRPRRWYRIALSAALVALAMAGAWRFAAPDRGAPSHAAVGTGEPALAPAEAPAPRLEPQAAIAEPDADAEPAIAVGEMDEPDGPARMVKPTSPHRSAAPSAAPKPAGSAPAGAPVEAAEEAEPPVDDPVDADLVNPYREASL